MRTARHAAHTQSHTNHTSSPTTFSLPGFKEMVGWRERVEVGVAKATGRARQVKPSTLGSRSRTGRR